MTKSHFRILYREFIFRVVDRQLLSSHASGDSHQVFTQIAAILVLFSAAMSIPAFDRNDEFSAPIRLFFAWRFEHFLIATTMLAVGLLAVLSWGSMFPDHRDVLVLAPLPVRARTILVAKIAAVATALGLAVAATHVVAGLVWPASLNRVAPAVSMPSLTRDPSMPPVGLAGMQSVLNRDLDEARDHGWLAPGSGGGLVIAISQHGERRLLTYGAARPDSIFQIGSLTKTFTGVALARMVQDGRVRLDTPVRELIPAARISPPARGERRRDITLVDLATHHSGLPTMPSRPVNRDNPFAAFGANDLHAYLRRHGLERPPDASFIYSNLGFGLLGHALASREQTNFASLVRQLVTEPLGLTDTVIDLSPDQQRRLLQAYDDEGQPVPGWKFDVLAPAGAMYSTASDLLVWLEANLHPSGPLAAAFDLSHRPRAATRDGERIGLAWMLDPVTGNMFHTGSVSGYTADAFFNQKGDIAAIVLANRSLGVSAPAPLVGDHIRARLAGRPAPSLGSVVVPATGGLRRWPRVVMAYWITMSAAGLFMAGLMIGLQGLAAALLSRRLFLRVSPILQVAAFFVLVAGYLIQPILFVGEDLVAAQSSGLFGSSPSYWFLGLFQSLIGSPAMPLLARRALASVALAIGIAMAAYAIAYVRTLRQIAEEPDIIATARAPRVPLIGRGPTRAVAGFTLKTLVRSAQPRVVMAFYWGTGFAFALAFIKTPTGQQLAAASVDGAAREISVPLLVASILMMGASVFAARNAFAMPRDLKANWIFRIVPLDGRGHASGRLRAIVAVTVVPVCALAAAACFPLWPWRAALGHVAALALFGLTLLDATEGGTQKIPFACSYLPGRSRFHIVFAAIVGVIIPLVIAAATFERDALGNAARYSLMISALAVAWLLARWRVRRLAHPDDRSPAFDDEPADRIVTLDLWDSRLGTLALQKDLHARPPV